jgi:hypothetical protein
MLALLGAHPIFHVSRIRVKLEVRRGRCQRHAPAALTQGKIPGIHCVGSWLGPRAGLDWGGAENLASTEIRCPDRPARSKSLYGLRYPGPLEPQLGHHIRIVLSVESRDC